MTYLDFKRKFFPSAVATANKIYGYKTLDLTNYESHVKEYAEDICKGWYVQWQFENDFYVYKPYTK